ncbi:MAG: hypothetical protein NXI22_11050 [bacterium]|nr:hypothetical protein [bacterium]
MINVKQSHRFLFAVALILIGASQLFAQGNGRHFQYDSRVPGGFIGQHQLTRGGPLQGYFQPVEIQAPVGTRIGLTHQQRYLDPLPQPARAGMLIGQVYRFKVTNIPGKPGFEVYPTIEVINRLFPPAGQEANFPVPIQLTQQELEFAIEGRMVTRVIYLENPDEAHPVKETPRTQRYFEIGAKDDPLHVADRLGRPMAILRMGSRIPTGAEHGFAQGAPPMIPLPQPTKPQRIYVPEIVERGDERPEVLENEGGLPIERLPLVPRFNVQ